MTRLTRMVLGTGLAVGACGAPPTPVMTPPGPTTLPAVVVSAVLPGARVHYVACSAVGHVSIELASEQSIPASARWTVRDADATDLARDPTIEQRVRLERPAFVARSGDASIVTTGMSRSDLDRLLSSLATADGGGDPAAHHVVGAVHLHLPWPAEFDGMTARRGDDVYAARFAYSSVFGGMAGAPSMPLAGEQFPWAVLKQPANDDGSGPLLTSWHGEVFVHDAVMSTDAMGEGVSDSTYLAFTEQALGAARAAGPTGCRVRTGGPAYPQAAGEVAFTTTQVQFTEAGRTRTIDVHDDGSVREAGIPIGSFASNGMMFRYSRGVRRIVGQVDRHGTILVNDQPAATIDDMLTAAAYAGPAPDRVPVGLALWIARH